MANMMSRQVAKELSDANIPVILSASRPSPATWETKDSLVGPPLTPSPARVLSEAGVRYAISAKEEGKQSNSQRYEFHGG
jgi:hypothetical protein